MQHLAALEDSQDQTFTDNSPGAGSRTQKQSGYFEDQGMCSPSLGKATEFTPWFWTSENPQNTLCNSGKKITNFSSFLRICQAAPTHSRTLLLTARQRTFSWGLLSAAPLELLIATLHSNSSPLDHLFC